MSEAIINEQDGASAVEQWLSDTPERRGVAQWLERCRSGADYAQYCAEIEARPVDSIIAGWGIERGSRCVIVAPSKTGKSIFATQLALALASGAEIVGRRCQRQRVLYVLAEGSATQQAQRVAGISRTQGLDVASADYVALDVVDGARPSVAQLLEVAKAERAQVVVLDSLYNLWGGDELDGAEAKRILAELDAFKGAGITLIYIAHTRKYGLAGECDITDAVSGSGVFGRDWDVAIRLSRHAERAGVINIETYSRAKDGDIIPTICARRPTLEERKAGAVGWWLDEASIPMLPTAETEKRRRQQETKRAEEAQARLSASTQGQNGADDWGRVVVRLVVQRPDITGREIEEALQDVHETARPARTREQARNAHEGARGLYKRVRDGLGWRSVLTPAGEALARDMGLLPPAEGQEIPPPPPAEAPTETPAEEGAQ